jgi:hypothetical protein
MMMLLMSLGYSFGGYVCCMVGWLLGCGGNNSALDDVVDDTNTVSLQPLKLILIAGPAKIGPGLATRLLIRRGACA